MPVTRETFGTYLSRLGYLPQDQNMDEGFNISKYHKLHKFVNNHVVLSQAGWWTSEVHPEWKHGGYNGDPSASNQVQRFCISGGDDFESFSIIPSTVFVVYNPLLHRFSWWMNGSPTATTRRCVKIYLYNKIHESSLWKSFEDSLFVRQVEMTPQMWEDLEIEPTLLQDCKDGKKRIVGKIWFWHHFCPKNTNILMIRKKICQEPID